MNSFQKSNNPLIIIPGMSVGVSNWRLIRKVSELSSRSVYNYMEVLAGTALETTMIRQLNNGDLDGKIRNSLAKFPDQEIANRIIEDYFIEGGK